MSEWLLQIHSSIWGVMVVLFILSYFFYWKKGLAIGLRLSYLVMIVTGVWMLAQIHFPGRLILKGILAIILIGLMEMALAKRKKQQPAVLFLVIGAIDLILVLLLGYHVI
ncbi:MAG: DUF1516 family protein [Sporolactobacillus sp.]|nr:DUF1516 family protein [Sporolactobacillus sp.]